MHKKIQWLIAKLTDGTPQKMLTQLHWIYQYGRRYWKAMILYTVLGVAGTGISLGSVSSTHLTLPTTVCV